MLPWLLHKPQTSHWTQTHSCCKVHQRSSRLHSVEQFQWQVLNPQQRHIHTSISITHLHLLLLWLIKQWIMKVMQWWHLLAVIQIHNNISMLPRRHLARLGAHLWLLQIRTINRDENQGPHLVGYVSLQLLQRVSRICRVNWLVSWSTRGMRLVRMTKTGLLHHMIPITLSYPVPEFVRPQQSLMDLTTHMRQLKQV